jgi:hypothetical protein
MSKNSNTPRSQQFREHLDGLSEDQRREALSRAIGQIYLATSSVELQATRLRVSESVVHTEHQSDGIFFLLALHRLMQLLVLAQQLAAPERRARLDEAIAALAATASETQDARDVIAHLDEYLVRFGKKHATAGEVPLPWFSRAGSDYTVRVGEYAINVDAAEAAAQDAFAAAFPLDD